MSINVKRHQEEKTYSRKIIQSQKELLKQYSSKTETIHWINYLDMIRSDYNRLW